MQANQQKRPREKLRTVSSPCCRSAQQQETGSQANDTLPDSGCPMVRGKSRRSVSRHVVNPCQNQSDKRKGGINPAVRTGNAVDHGHKEKQQRGGLTRQIS